MVEPMTDTIEEPALKRCSKCGELKPLSKFYSDKRASDVLSCSCKDCKHEYYIKNKENILAARKNHYLKNIDYMHEKNMNDYCKNRDARLLWQKNYYLENKEEIEEYRKKYYADNHEEISVKNKKNYEKNREERLRWQKEYSKTENGKISHKNTTHRRRQLINKTPVCDQLTIDQWDKIIESQNRRCAMCGMKFTEDISPTIDHILPLSKGGNHSSDNIQALCHSCNSKKHNKIDYGYIQAWGIN